MHNNNNNKNQNEKQPRVKGIDVMQMIFHM